MSRKAWLVPFAVIFLLILTFAGPGINASMIGGAIPAWMVYVIALYAILSLTSGLFTAYAWPKKIEEFEKRGE
ncbi:MAG: hypothetical protein HYY09_06815 [Firmicutes bacterium]|nr:hypothetical protein [Bacillota bacterium]